METKRIFGHENGTVDGGEYAKADFLKRLPAEPMTPARKAQSYLPK
jgi:hypothetical protein